MVTVDELDKFMSELFLSSQLKKVGYTDLTEQDKNVLINKATLEIDRLMFSGDKLEETQPHAFPRVINGELVEISNIKNAIAEYIYDYMYLETDERIEKMQKGITSIKIADASESYSISALDVNKIRNNYKRYLVDFIYRGC